MSEPISIQEHPLSPVKCLRVTWENGAIGRGAEIPFHPGELQSLPQLVDFFQKVTDYLEKLEKDQDV